MELIDQQKLEGASSQPDASLLTSMKMNQRQMRILLVVLSIAQTLFRRSYGWIPHPSLAVHRTLSLSFRNRAELSSSICTSNRVVCIKSQLYSIQPSAGSSLSTNITSKAARITHHLSIASQSSNDDITSQVRETESAERELLQWVEEYRRRSREEVNKPDATVFRDVILGLLALPSESMRANTVDSSDEANVKTMDQLRTVLKQGKRHNTFNAIYETKSDRATKILDLMESLYAPLGSLYDSVIAAHCVDALEYLQQKQSDAACKSAKSALALLNRSEELYRETGEEPIQLPSITSYVSVMDVWKALAVKAEESKNDKKGEVALDIVRALHSRRLEVYSFNGGANVGINDGKYNIIPADKSSSVTKVLEYAANMLHEAEPSYTPSTTKDAIGTWHFNQLIFDLAKHPQSFSGPLAQDLLEFMVTAVKKSSAKINGVQSRTKSSYSANPVVPKPNTDTINGVLKAWMVTPKINDAARRAEAVLAQLAIWQADGTLWGVNPDVVSYNTVISCWKESGTSGCAARATEILALLEADSTDIQPDNISYATTIGTWAETSSRDKGAGRRAEEILTRMYQRSKADNTCPRPNTRCFNAVLLAYANGREVGGGKRALDLLRFMERLHSEGYAHVQPDAYTLNIVMKALTNCGEEGAAEKANEILKRMEESFKSGDSKLKPDLLSYNTVLDSFAKKGDAISAEALLNRMYKKAEKDADMTMPNAHSYTSVLSAWARHEDKIMAVKRAEDLFTDLESKWAAGETDTRADTSVYNALINCWAKSGDRKTLYRVTQLLNLMEELGLQGGDSDVEPNSRTYCAVLDALARSKNWKAYNESLGILDRMEELYADGYDSVRPCARAYSIVISTIARSRKKGKSLKAQEILHRMESEYRKGNISARPTVYSYNAVLNAAAYTPRGDEREQEDAFKVACLTFDQLRMSDYLEPTHVSYGTFLKAIQSHMPSSDLRDNLVKRIFRRCCRYAHFYIYLLVTIPRILHSADISYTYFIEMDK